MRIRPDTCDPKLLLLLTLFLASCSSSPQSRSAALTTFARAVIEIDRAYVERPELRLVATGAAQALSDLAPNARISLTPSVERTIVTYGDIEGENGTITLSEGISPDQVCADLTPLFRFARDVRL